MLNGRLHAELEVLAREGARLAGELRFAWSGQTQQAVQALRYLRGIPEGERPAVIGIVGGASSGKSTVFNNLLDGHVASFVTARGHATRGAILGVYDAAGDSNAGTRLLLPDYPRRSSGLDDSADGSPEVLTVVQHDLEALQRVILCDTPDLTSEVSRVEGDVALALLPWFDRLLVLVDAERWFDRQAIDQLREASERFGQQRMIVFNRSREGPLDPIDRQALDEQSRRFAASASLTVEYHRGRGCRKLADSELVQMRAFLTQPAPPREAPLQRFLAEAAGRVLRENEERAARLIQLRAQVSREAEGCIPSTWECLTVLMKPAEREQLNVAARVLRVSQWKAWVERQTGWLEKTLGRIPVLGTFAPRRREVVSVTPAPEVGRDVVGFEHFRAACRQARYAVRRAARASAFWEIAPLADPQDDGRSGLQAATSTSEATAPATPATTLVVDDATERRARQALSDLDEAMARWNAKVANECRGTVSNVAGAVGLTAVGAVVVLVAVSGPVTLLTLPAAKVALGAAFGKLLGLAGAGALTGRPLHRFVEVISERLVGSPEFNAIKDAAENYRQVIAAFARHEAEAIIEAADRLVLRKGNPLRDALERVRPALDATARGQGSDAERSA